jgi:steroid 5-alpha reductase family enzyme
VSFLELFGIVGLLILGMMSALWLVSLWLKDSSIVDIFWGAGFVVVNWVSFFLVPEGVPARQWLLNVLVTLWGLRLAIHIFLRNAGKGEDFRYRKWREESGRNWWWFSFFKVFLLQGVLMWIISVPIVAVQNAVQPQNLIWLDFVGVAVWLFGFFFEAVGDWQLKRFKSNPENKGKVLKSGVWRYTRHPNYFGDAAQWWGFYLIALAAGAFWTIFSPIIMTILLLRISGVALLEKSLEDTKPGYQAYKETTSAFVPWFLKKQKGRD